MRYIMKQQLLAIGDDFAVEDEHGNPCYYFDGKVLTLRKKLIVSGPSGEMGRVESALFSFVPTFSVKLGGREIARIRKKILAFRPSFVIKVHGGHPITVTGRLLEHDYRFMRQGLEIGLVSKKWFRGRDTYGIEVHDPSESYIILSAAVVIDLICHPKRDSTFGQ